MRVWTHWRGFAAVACIAGLLWGCGRGGPARPKTYPVTGTVTQKGAPVAQATVTFIGVDGKRVAAGLTDANGRYSLTTFQKGDGALPGEYRVKVEKFEKPAAPAPTSSSETKGPAEDKSYVPPPEISGDAAPAGPKNLLPAKYANPNTSGLTATVKEGPNEFNFAVD